MRTENQQPDCMNAVLDKSELYTNFGFQYRPGPPFWFYETEDAGYCFGSYRANLFDDIVASGCMGCATDDILGRLCNFVDTLVHANLMKCSDFVSLTFRGRHFAAATPASHMAYFFAANPSYGVSPSKGYVVTNRWIDDNIDLFNGAYILDREYMRDTFDEEYRMVVDQKRHCPSRVFPPRSWMRENIDDFSLAFTHDEGVRCLHKALGVYDFIDPLRKYARALVDATIASHVFEMDPKDAGRPWKHNWHINDDDFPGERLWKAFNEIDRLWRRVIRDDRSVRIGELYELVSKRVGKGNVDMHNIPREIK